MALQFRTIYEHLEEETKTKHFLDSFLATCKFKRGHKMETDKKQNTEGKHGGQIRK